MGQCKGLEVLLEPWNLHKSIKVYVPIRHRQIRTSVHYYLARIHTAIGRQESRYKNLSTVVTVAVVPFSSPCAIIGGGDEVSNIGRIVGSLIVS